MQVPVTMAHSRNDYYKHQDVEIYDSSKDRWVGGKICDIKIRESDRQKIYCVEYEEYAKEIAANDPHFLMRIPKPKRESNDYAVNKAFINFRRKIPTQSPVSREMKIMLNDIRSSTAQRTIYLFMRIEYTLC